MTHCSVRITSPPGVSSSVRGGPPRLHQAPEQQLEAAPGSQPSNWMPRPRPTAGWNPPSTRARISPPFPRLAPPRPAAQRSQKASRSRNRNGMHLSKNCFHGMYAQLNQHCACPLDSSQTESCSQCRRPAGQIPLTRTETVRFVSPFLPFQLPVCQLHLGSFIQESAREA